MTVIFDVIATVVVSHDRVYRLCTEPNTTDLTETEFIPRPTLPGPS